MAKVERNFKGFAEEGDRGQKHALGLVLSVYLCEGTRGSSDLALVYWVLGTGVCLGFTILIMYLLWAVKV